MYFKNEKSGIFFCNNLYWIVCFLKDRYKNRKCIYRTKLYNFSFGGNDADHEDNVEDEDDKSLKSLNEDRGTYLSNKHFIKSFK